jgi:ABC-type multidrug transport system permease subunit
MLPSAPVSSSSISGATLAVTGASLLRLNLLALLASWRAMTNERLYLFGLGGGFMVLGIQPLLQITLLSIIYGADSPLFGYIVVAQAANAFVMNTVFWVGEILDRERVKGTLVSLFLAPCARFSWLTGFILAGVAETAIISTVAILFGRFVFGVHFAPNLPVLAVTAMLFLAALWGMGLIFSGFGLLVRKANPLANLLWTFIILLGGAYYPISQLPDWLRYPARALPLGYGMEALADAALRNASFSDVSADLIPLAAFALVLPAVGVLTFGWLERKVRVRGELDLY